jgi:hypothetical protein
MPEEVKNYLTSLSVLINKTFENFVFKVANISLTYIDKNLFSFLHHTL